MRKYFICFNVTEIYWPLCQYLIMYTFSVNSLNIDINVQKKNVYINVLMSITCTQIRVMKMPLFYDYLLMSFFVNFLAQCLHETAAMTCTSEDAVHKCTHV